MPFISFLGVLGPGPDVLNVHDARRIGDHYTNRTLCFLALPKLSLFSALEEVIKNHPSPDELKKEALGHLYTVLRECMGMEAGAVNMLAWRHLEPVRGASGTKGKAKADPDDNSVGQVGDGDALRDREGREEDTEGREEPRLTHTVEMVEAVRQANEEYLVSLRGVGAVRRCDQAEIEARWRGRERKRQEVYDAYAKFIEGLCARGIDVYLVSSFITIASHLGLHVCVCVWRGLFHIVPWYTGH